MVLFNYATKEITAKIVYYGPGLCGKTTNLQFVYDSLPSNNKSKMLSLATKTDRTLFFDFLPLDLGKIAGCANWLYTVPVRPTNLRQLVLGPDGIVFVATRRILRSTQTSNRCRTRGQPKRRASACARCRWCSSTTSAISERDGGRGDGCGDQQAPRTRVRVVATTGLMEETLKGITHLAFHLVKKRTRRFGPLDINILNAPAQPQPASDTLWDDGGEPFSAASASPGPRARARFRCRRSAKRSSSCSRAGRQHPARRHGRAAAAGNPFDDYQSADAASMEVPTTSIEIRCRGVPESPDPGRTAGRESGCIVPAIADCGHGRAGEGNISESDAGQAPHRRLR
jgi:hypothetical protein